MVTARQRLTFEEFLRLPEEKPALEYFYGTVTQKVSPKARHGRLQLRFGMMIEIAAGEPPAFWAMTELRVHWPGKVSFVPDLAVYRVERLPGGPSGEIEDDLFVPPDVAVEVVSPSQSLFETLERARWFVRHGVTAVVIIQPRDRSVRVVREDAESGPYFGDELVDLSDALSGFTFVVRDLFAAIDLPQSTLPDAS